MKINLTFLTMKRVKLLVIITAVAVLAAVSLPGCAPKQEALSPVYVLFEIPGKTGSLVTFTFEADGMPVAKQYETGGRFAEGAFDPSATFSEPVLSAEISTNVLKYLNGLILGGDTTSVKDGNGRVTSASGFDKDSEKDAALVVESGILNADGTFSGRRCAVEAADSGEKAPVFGSPLSDHIPEARVAAAFSRPSVDLAPGTVTYVKNLSELNKTREKVTLTVKDLPGEYVYLLSRKNGMNYALAVFEDASGPRIGLYESVSGFEEDSLRSGMPATRLLEISCKGSLYPLFMRLKEARSADNTGSKVTALGSDPSDPVTANIAVFATMFNFDKYLDFSPDLSKLF